jgi:hypothetical protein
LDTHHDVATSLVELGWVHRALERIDVHMVLIRENELPQLEVRIKIGFVAFLHR